MSLTGPGLVIILGIAAAIVFAALATGWPRNRSRRGRPTLLLAIQRTGGLVLLNVLVLAVAGALLNDQYSFYVSWADLFGARAPSTVSRHGASATAAASTKVGGGLAAILGAGTLPPLPSPGQRVQTYTVVGPRSHLTGQVAVLLPQGYDPRSARRYPVVEAFHGVPGTVNSWLSGMHAQAAFDGLVTARQLAPSIVVLPQVNIPYGLDSECIDGPPGTPQTETWLATDIPRFVATHFRVRLDRGSWAAAGFSEGAYCAALVGMHHPGVFGAALALGGYFRPIFSLDYQPYTARTLPLRDNLIWVAGHRPPALALWIQTSHQDGLSYPSTAAFLRAVRRPLSVTTLIIKTGGHRESLWATELPTALRWLAASLPGFRA
ncbi:MAG TPA: alpha/beta hydrolase-fold protein [Dermatophilaceae bacterium]|nr:alpha/beta hydrolase-fold protein [Dermatophilaceae bacterium]